MNRFVNKTGRWVLAALALALFRPAVMQAASPIWAPPSLEALIDEGLASNNEIKSLEEQVASLKHEVSVAGSLEDPRLGFALLNMPTDTFSFSQEAMTQKQIFVAQKLPWFGKLDLRTQRATLKALRQRAVLEARRLGLARQIAAAYYDIGFVAASLSINAQLTDTVTQLLGVAETRYATGRGLQQDVLQAQVELSKLIDENIRLKKRWRTLEDRINALLNRPSFQAVLPPAALAYPGLSLDIESLQARVLQTNPQLKIRQAEIDMAAVEIQLARKDYWPDMDVKLAYGQREEDFNGRDLPDLFTASLTMNLPVWQKRRQTPRLEATRRSHQATLRSYRNLVDSLPYQVESLATEIRDIQKNYQLFNDALLVQADQWASASLSAYEVGKLEFNTMIAAQIRLLRFELQASNYLYTIYQKRAELEELLGGSI
jgi:outer membrane protein TolC